MAPRGKKRASQRGRQTRKDTDSRNIEVPRDGPSSPEKPSLQKKRRVVVRSPATTPETARPSESRRDGNVSHGQNEGREEQPIEGEQNEIEKSCRVRTPPASSRQPPSRREKSIPPRTVESPPSTNHFRTADTIPEETESDDREVCMIRRQPLENNLFYKRYISSDFHDEDIPRGVGRGVFSPVSPANRDDDNQADGRRIVGEGGREDVLFAGGTGTVLFGDSEDAYQDTRKLRMKLLEDVKQTISSEMKTLHSFISGKFGRLDSLEANVLQQLNEIRVLYSTGRSGNIAQGRPTPLAKYECKLDAATPHGDWVFNTETICKILRANLCMFIVSVVSESGDTLESISLALRAVLFGLLPSKKRASYKSGVGRKHSEFRFTVVLNILFNVQQNVFERFLPLDLSNDGQNPQVINVIDGGASGAHAIPLGNDVIQIKQPKWLKSAFIRKTHVEEARARLESNVGCADGLGDEPVSTGRSRRSWITVKEAPDSGDIARYGALKVYRYVTTGLYQAREKARWMLYEDLLYLMTIWEEERGDIDQCTLEMKWNEGVEFTAAECSDIPLCAKRKAEPGKVDDENTYNFAQFLSSRPEMVLYVAHDVNIRNVGNCSSRRYAEVKSLRRSINLIDVATKFCVVFTEQTAGEVSHLPFLGAHEDSLKAIYVVAKMLHRMVTSFMEDYILNGSFVGKQDDGAPRVECHGLSLEHLLPAASVRKRLLASRCLRMSIDEYDKFNLAGNNSAGESGFNQTSAIDDDNIAIGDHGVMLL